MCVNSTHRHHLLKKTIRLMNRSYSVFTPHVLVSCLCLVLLCAPQESAAESSTPESLANAPRFTETLGTVRDTEGNLRSELLYTLQLNGMTVFFRNSGVSYVLTSYRDEYPGEEHRETGACLHSEADCLQHGKITVPDKVYRVDVDLLGHSGGIQLIGEDQSTAAIRRYTGSGTASEQNLRTYGKLRYRNVYPGIDLLFYTADGGLKYDFILQPGADPKQIQLQYTGASRLQLEDGSLLVGSPLGDIREHPPVCYVPGTFAQPLQHVHSAYKLEGNVLSFDVEDTGSGRPLVLDPFVEWSTYAGGLMSDGGTSTAFAANGDILVAGWSSSPDFPVTAGSLQPVKAGLTDAFIMRFTPDGTLLWSTYFGGDIVDAILDVAMANNGDIIVGGFTNSSNFPTTPGAFQESIRGNLDGFVARLRQNGTLFWCTLFGGSSLDEVGGVGVDSQDFVYITGRTLSTNFPRTANGFQLVLSGDSDAHIAKFTPDGDRVWASYYGGSSEDWGHALAVNSRDEVIIVGHTQSADFPVGGGVFQQNRKAFRDGYMVKFRPDGTRAWGSFISGRDWDDAYDIAVDDDDHIVVVGGTVSPDFPVTSGSFQSTFAGLYDAYVLRFDDAVSLLWGSFYGADDQEIFHSVDVFPSGNIMAAGYSVSDGLFTTPDAPQRNRAGRADNIVVKFRADGSVPWATYFGGSGTEYEDTFFGIMGIATDPRGNTVLVSRSNSSDYPVTGGAMQPEYGGDSWDATVTKFGCNVVPPPLVTPLGDVEFCEGGSVTLDAGNSHSNYIWSTGDTTQTITVSTSGDYYVTVTDTNDCVEDSPPITVVVYPLPQPFISPDGVTELCDGEDVTLDAGAGWSSYLWSTGDTTRTISVDYSGTFSVSVVDVNSSPGTSQEVEVLVHPNPVPALAANGPTEFCEGGNVVLDAGGDFAQYLWSTGDTTRTITVSTSGTYSVVVENEFGCSTPSAEIDVTVYPLPQPVITPLSATSFCEGESTTLDAGAGYVSYDWNTGDTTREITVDTPGDYFVTVTDINGCSAVADIVTVEVFPLPDPQITASGPTEFCIGGSVVLDAGSGYAQYEWSSGEAVQAITVSDAGSYSVQVWTDDGCSAISTEIDVVVYPNPQPVITPLGPLEFCVGDTIQLEASAGFATYQWNTGDTGRYLSVYQSGTYFVNTASVDGCPNTSESISIIVHPLPAQPVIRQQRDSLISTPAFSYQWNLNGSPLTGETDSVLLIPQSGVYTVTITSPEGCSRESDPLDITIATVTIEIPDIQAEPGERVRIPVLITSSDLLVESGARNFNASVSFDKNILYNLSPQGGWSVLADDRRVDFAAQWNGASQTLAEFEVLAMLGNVQSTPLRIERFEWLEGAVRVTTIDGEFTLEVCEEGGPRLFDASGTMQLAQNSPNPFNSMTSIQYETIERGTTKLFVLDMLGRKVATLVDEYREPGVYSVQFDAGDLPSGKYIYVLQTPNMVTRRIMHLLK